MKRRIKISKKWLKPFKNIFILITLIFIFWMLFFDANSWLIQRELNKEIDFLNTKKEFYINEIKKDLQDKKSLETLDGLEKYAREKYYMKHKDEDIFLIELGTEKIKE